MTPVAFDSETCLIRPALLAPPMVCLTWARPGLEPRIEHVLGARPVLRSWLLDPTTLLVGHNVAFDLAVVCAEFPDLTPLVFDAYKANRVTCTKKRQQLLDIAGGVYRGRYGEKGRWIQHNYHLSDLAKRHLGRTMQKDGWRYTYAEFRDVPLVSWPDHARALQARAKARRAELPAVLEKDSPHVDEARNLDAIIADVPEGVIRYPLEDAEITLGVYLAQEKHADYLADQYRQAYADFVLYLSSAWGLRTHKPGVDTLRAELEEAHAEISAELQALGLVRADGTRDMSAIKAKMIDACRDLGLPLRRTDAHEDCELGDACTKHVCLDSDACEAVTIAAESSSDVDTPFTEYAEFVMLGKMISNDCKMLEAGTVYPVHTHYDLAETGRTTSSKPNIQNLNTGRVKNEKSLAQRLRKGVRQAFVPRSGYVFAQADFPQLELYTLAQTCLAWLGYSQLARDLNAGMDPHLVVAAKICGLSYDEAAKNKKRDDVDHARQIGKVFNFGKPGGIGNKKLKLWARKTYGVDLSIEKLQEYEAQWHATYPEMRMHFARVNSLFEGDAQKASIKTLYTERYRGAATYCAACNNGFQGLGADCAKQAICLVAEAEYVNVSSPLYGSRTVAFVHDELIVETLDTDNAHDAAHELARLMVVGANTYLPDVPIPLARMEPTLMRRWDKGAKPLFQDGRLVPWT